MGDKCIKVNIPLNEEDYITGNGEGVWVEIDWKTEELYDQDAVGTGYYGVLANDSLYYPELGCGDIIAFEMRGEHRPVADFHGFLKGSNRLSEHDKMLVIKRIAERTAGAI